MNKCEFVLLDETRIDSSSCFFVSFAIMHLSRSSSDEFLTSSLYINAFSLLRIFSLRILYKLIKVYRIKQTINVAHNITMIFCMLEESRIIEILESR